MQTSIHTQAEGASSVTPSFTLKASNKFAPQLIRLLADLSLSHSDDDAADYLALNELANQMEEWREANPDAPADTTAEVTTEACES